MYSNVQPELPLQNSPACSDASAQTPGFLVQEVFLPTRKMGKFEQKLLQMRMSINYLTNSKNISRAAEKLGSRYATARRHRHTFIEPASSLGSPIIAINKQQLESVTNVTKVTRLLPRFVIEFTPETCQSLQLLNNFQNQTQKHFSR